MLFFSAEVVLGLGLIIWSIYSIVVGATALALDMG